MKNIHRKNDAFTMIELIFAIIVMGILAALAIPRLDRDFRQEAKDNFLSAIRYTQHMALTDDKTNPFDNKWEDNYWKLVFANDGSNYSISSGMAGTTTGIKYAVDPTSGKLYNGDDATGSKATKVGAKFSISSVTSGGGCASPQIAFDHFGRPLDWTPPAGVDTTTPRAKYMKSDCTLTFNFSKSGVDPLVVTIATETGAVTGN